MHPCLPYETDTLPFQELRSLPQLGNASVFLESGVCLRHGPSVPLVAPRNSRSGPSPSRPPRSCILTQFFFIASSETKALSNVIIASWGHPEHSRSKTESSLAFTCICSSHKIILSKSVKPALFSVQFCTFWQLPAVT